MKEFWQNLTFGGKLKFVISVVLSILGAIFATLNWKVQEVHFIFFKKEMPLSLLIIFSICSGYGISFLLNMRAFRKKDRLIESLKNQLEEAKVAQKIKTTDESVDSN